MFYSHGAGQVVKLMPVGVSHAFYRTGFSGDKGVFHAADHLIGGQPFCRCSIGDSQRDFLVGRSGCYGIADQNERDPSFGLPGILL